MYAKPSVSTQSMPQDVFDHVIIILLQLKAALKQNAEKRASAAGISMTKTSITTSTNIPASGSQLTNEELQMVRAKIAVMNSRCHEEG